MALEGLTIAHIEVAEKMVRCQKAMKSLFKSEYPAKVSLYKSIISGYRDKHKLETLPAVIELGQQAAFRDNEAATIWLMAGAIEIISEQK